MCIFGTLVPSALIVFDSRKRMMSPHALSFCSIQQWWGGPEKKERIWNDYKDARNAILKKEKDNGDRQILVQDLRQEFRDKYPAYAHMWN